MTYFDSNCEVKGCKRGDAMAVYLTEDWKQIREMQPGIRQSLKVCPLCRKMMMSEAYRGEYGGKDA
jgi:hypothetical protein